MTHEPIHYVPVVEQSYAEIIENLEQHPARNQWSRADRQRLALQLGSLASSTHNLGPGDTTIPMAVELVRDVSRWLPDAAGFSPSGLIDLLKSYVQPEDER